MSTLSKTVKEARKTEKVIKELKPVKNFMGGISYGLNPLDTLKIVAASSIFGEPAYYRHGAFAQKGVKDGHYSIKATQANSILLKDEFKNNTTSQVMEKVIDTALTYDFEGTLQLAMTLRGEMNMRLNPQVIMVRAALHPNRKAFNDANPGVYKAMCVNVMRRADEPATQLAYYLYNNGGSKSKLPSVLKRAWASRIENMNRYQMYKYKNSGLGLIDTIRVCHASSAKNPMIKELLETGNLVMNEEDKTWETLRASGKTWYEILTTIDMPHMALLRNLRGIFGEINNTAQATEILEALIKGVKHGKQFPFRYMSAMNAVRESICNHKPLILDYLEKCMDVSVENMPKLKGRTMCLSDNSGSAHGAFTSEYGRVRVAEIGNLSSVITAQLSEEGYVGLFGDKLDVHPVSKRNGVLSQAASLNKAGKNVGMGTENGIWLFFRDAIEKKEHWDNIFVYSDMQAGHGGLYGIKSSEYKDYIYGGRGMGSHIDVMKLIQTYKSTVNPKVNVFMVQTAGYTNTLIPENFHRGAILTGWTGKEGVYAHDIIRTWDEVENRPKQ